MTDLPRRLPALLAAFLLGGCVEDEAMDYCKNHYRFHADHRDRLGTLTVNLDEEGQLNSELLLPSVLFGEDEAAGDTGLAAAGQRLSNVGQLYTVQSARPCGETTEKQDLSDAGLRITTTADCGADNKVEQVDVALFDTLPDLDEIEVEVTTPATKKHFAISRQCDHPLFRLHH